MTKAERIGYLIIGNSAAGVGAAEAIREVDKVRTIAIVSDEPYPAYSRPLAVGEKDDILYLSSEESAIRLICPDLDRTWIPMGGEPVVGKLWLPLRLQPVADKETV
jgi:NADPH-dependent 2,4-dienoyl-CoA reductase/sulfur reductase-like enzyme